jgi:hypothetical protein
MTCRGDGPKHARFSQLEQHIGYMFRLLSAAIIRPVPNIQKEIFFPWRHSPQWARTSSLSRLHDHTQAHHSRYDSSGQELGPAQRPLPDSTQHSQETDIHAPGSIRIHDPGKQATADPRRRPRGHWDRPEINHTATILAGGGGPYNVLYKVHNVLNVYIGKIYVVGFKMCNCITSYALDNCSCILTALLVKWELDLATLYDVRSFETSVTTRPTKQSHIPHDQNPLHHDVI